MKDLKKRAEEKERAREALDQMVYGGDATAFPLRDTTIGHVEGPEGTWNTSGVEVPRQTGAVRDVRPETGDVVSVENLKEIGVPVRDASDYTTERPAPFMPAPARVETEDRTLEIPAAREAVAEAQEEADPTDASPKAAKGTSRKTPKK